MLLCEICFQAFVAWQNSIIFSLFTYVSIYVCMYAHMVTCKRACICCIRVWRPQGDAESLCWWLIYFLLWGRASFFLLKVMFYIYFIINIILCVWVSCLHVCLCVMCKLGAWRGQKEGTEFPVTEVTGAYELLNGCWLGMEPQSSWRAAVLLVAEPSSPESGFLNQTQSNIASFWEAHPTPQVLPAI